jgi:capsular polysaccharide transport system permease protein
MRVLRALVLRDMRSRFGTGFVSYLVAIGIPFFHLLFLMAGPVLANQIAPLGTDYALFVATGVLPYILCLYPARMIMLCLVDSGPLLAFPIVKPLDVMIARALLETVVAFTVTVLFLLVLLVGDIEVVPYDTAQATGAIFATIYFGISVGFANAILYKLTRAWMFVFIGIIVVMYIASSAFFLPSMVSPEIRAAMWFDPIFHSVEWLRLGYYEGYGEHILSRQYLLGFSTALLALGILFERLIRGRLVLAG